MTVRSEGERMAVLETTVQNLDRKITDIQSDVKAIIVTLSKQPTLEAEIIALKSEIMDMKKSSNLWKWLAPTLTGIASAILCSTLTFLIINYFQNAK